jgi:mono/diheme cytochrome c family protein
MRRFLKWIGIVLGGLIGLLILAVVGLLIYGQLSFKRTHADWPLRPITADTSPEGLARGQYLMENVMGCDQACHSPQGTPFVGEFEEINEGPISAVFAVPNLTPDQGTGLGAWTDAQIARAIREGVDKDGVELVIMPSQNYRALSDADVAAMVAYLRHLEPVRNEIPPFQVNAVGKVMLALGMLGPRPSSQPLPGPQNAPTPGTAEYGGYLVALGACRDCHGEALSGGKIPFSPPDTPAAPNLTPAGNLPKWSEADFVKAIRNGVTPDGRTLDPEGMPWPSYGRMTDADLGAIFKYLQSLPPVESEQ